jgi:hypothetical protein
MSDWAYIKKLGGEGILSRQDVRDLKNQRAKVLYLMLDGLWHQADQIISYSGGREGLRRLRELREIPGVTIERIPHPSRKRDFMYRLVYDKGIQGDFFTE